MRLSLAALAAVPAASAAAVCIIAVFPIHDNLYRIGKGICLLNIVYISLLLINYGFGLLKLESQKSLSYRELKNLLFERLIFTTILFGLLVHLVVLLLWGLWDPIGYTLYITEILLMLAFKHFRFLKLYLYILNLILLLMLFRILPLFPILELWKSLDEFLAIISLLFSNIFFLALVEYLRKRAYVLEFLKSPQMYSLLFKGATNYMTVHTLKGIVSTIQFLGRLPRYLQAKQYSILSAFFKIFIDTEGEYPVVRMINLMKKTFSPYFDNLKIRVVVKLPEKCKRVKIACSTGIVDILFNIFENAVKGVSGLPYDKRYICLKVSCDKHNIVFSIKNPTRCDLEKVKPISTLKISDFLLRLSKRGKLEFSNSQKSGFCFFRTKIILIR